MINLDGIAAPLCNGITKLDKPKAHLWEKVASISAVIAILVSFGAVLAQNEFGKSLERKKSALNFCHSYLYNEKINEFSGQIYEISQHIQAIPKFEKILAPASELEDDSRAENIKHAREDFLQFLRSNSESHHENTYKGRTQSLLSQKIDESKRSFGQMMNFFAQSISGVRSNVYDESIIRDCLSEQMICFREKYSVRTGIIPWNNEVMRDIKSFIDEGEDKAEQICDFATEEHW